MCYLCLRNIIRKGGRFEGVSRELSPILAPVFQCTFRSLPCAQDGYFYWLACWETAVGTGWSAAGGSRSASTYRACLVARGDHGVDVWADWRDE